MIKPIYAILGIIGAGIVAAFALEKDDPDEYKIRKAKIVKNEKDDDDTPPPASKPAKTGGKNKADESPGKEKGDAEQK